MMVLCFSTTASTISDTWTSLHDPVLDEVAVEVMMIGEDMCYKNGLLISPALVWEFILPADKKLTSFLWD